MCLEHTFAWNRFFFFPPDSHSNTHPLTPLHLATRIEAARRHWRAHWACRLTLAHPGMRLVGDHPSRRAKPRVPRPIYDTYKGRLHCSHFRKQVAESPAAWLPASIQGFACNCLLWLFLVTIISVVTMLQQSFSCRYTVLLLDAIVDHF